MKQNNKVSRLAALSVSLIAAVDAVAHPGHEPDSLIHALAHQLASPRGILALIILGVAGALYVLGRIHKK
jgi:hypothetical protein